MQDSVTSALLENRFAAPTKELKEFLQDDLASWYVEAAKTRFQEQFGGKPGSQEAVTSQKVLLHLLEVSLKMLHPFMPFVTEAVWQRLPLGDSPPRSLMISPWPRAEGQSSRDVEAEGWFTKLCSMVTAIRNARAEQGVKPKERLPMTLWCKDAKFQAAIEAEGAVLAWLSRADPQQLKACPKSDQPAEMPEGVVRVLVGDDLEVDIVVPKVEVDIEKELQRLQKQLDQVTAFLETTEKKISPQFLERAAPAVKEKTLAKRDELRQQKESLMSQIEELRPEGGASRRELASAVAAFLLGSGCAPEANADDSDLSLNSGDSLKLPDFGGGKAALPSGARQEDRIRKAIKSWSDLPAKLKSAEDLQKEDQQKEWDNCQGFLRRIYGLNDDMTYLGKGLRDEKKAKAENLVTNFKKQVKAADKPAKAKDYDAFMVFHAEIAGYLKEFTTLLVDTVEDITMDQEEEDVIVSFTSKKKR